MKAKDKVAKKLAKKVVTIAKNSSYERLYQKLKTKGSKKDVFELARAKKKKKEPRKHTMH